MGQFAAMLPMLASAAQNQQGGQQGMSMPKEVNQVRDLIQQNNPLGSLMGMENNPIVKEKQEAGALADTQSQFIPSAPQTPSISANLDLSPAQADMNKTEDETLAAKLQALKGMF
jgi:hypothetical protein